MPPQVAGPLRDDTSLRVRNYIHDVVDVILDEEIKTPVCVNAGLPEVEALVVLLGAERRVPQVLLQKPHLLEQRPADVEREDSQASCRHVRSSQPSSRAFGLSRRLLSF